MAKRNKKRGASFGKKSGGKSTEIQRQRETRQTTMYTLAGIGGVLAVCLMLWAFSQVNLGSIGIADSNSAESVSEETQVIDSSTDDSADTGSESSASFDDSDFEPIDADEFSLVESSGELAELDPVERNRYYTAPFEMSIDTDKIYEAVMKTEKGDMRFRLYTDRSPVTVNNFVNLATVGFFDGTTFHRVLDQFMAQGGDPTGTGTGGPGYRFQDEFDNGLSFNKRGLLAMANSGPETNGSQFFITFVPTPHLDNRHTIFGEIIEGDDVLASIDLRDPSSAAEPGNVIETVEIYITD